MARKKDRGADVSWTPVLRGATYCSPACGCGCTKAAYDEAVREAYLLVRCLRGSGWAPRVWENVGWHFRAVSGPVQVNADIASSGRSLYVYWCLISDHVDDPVGGSMIWTRQRATSYRDPNEAVQAELRTALEATAGVLDAVYAASVAAEYDQDNLPIVSRDLMQVARGLGLGKRRGRVKLRRGGGR